jgi:myo-inositol-1(or 4)-monophosphatase
VNYLYDLPAWAVSVAAEVDGESVVGVVHVPALGETFTAVRGGGAYLGARRLRANPPVPPQAALVATGFGYDARRRRRQGAVLAELVGRVRDVRRGGSAAIDLCHVAAGRVDAYYEQGTQRWDVAAAGLIAAEAGARVEGLRGEPASPRMVLAAPPGLFEPLHDLLVELGVDSDGDHDSDHDGGHGGGPESRLDSDDGQR